MGDGAQALEDQGAPLSAAIIAYLSVRSVISVRANAEAWFCPCHARAWVTKHDLPGAI